MNDGVEVAAKTDPNNPLNRPAPDMDAPDAPPSAPPGPDYVKKISELTKDNATKVVRIEELEATEKAHLATISEINATNASLTATVETQKKTIANLNVENADIKQQFSNSREEVVNTTPSSTVTPPKAGTTTSSEPPLLVSSTPTIYKNGKPGIPCPNKPKPQWLPANQQPLTKIYKLVFSSYTHLSLKGKIRRRIHTGPPLFYIWKGKSIRKTSCNKKGK